MRIQLINSLFNRNEENIDPERYLKDRTVSFGRNGRLIPYTLSSWLQTLILISAVEVVSRQGTPFSTSLFHMTHVFTMAIWYTYKHLSKKEIEGLILVFNKFILVENSTHIEQSCI